MQSLLRIFLTTATILVSLSMIPAGHSVELTRGAILAASCDGCHGTDGRSPGAMPDISGKSANYIRNALEDFSSGRRESTVMGRQAKGYTDEEISLIAEYFAARD